MKVAVNAVPLRSPATGVGQYLYNLMRAISARQLAELHYFYGSHWNTQLLYKPSAAIDEVKAVVKRVVPYPYIVSRMAQTWMFNRGLRANKPDLYHEPNFTAFATRTPSVLSVHDLSFIFYRDTHPEDRLANLARHLQPSLDRASLILTGAEVVKQEIEAELKIDPKRIVVTPYGVSEDFRPMTAEQTANTLARHQLKHGGYLLAVGTLEPRKNLASAIRAYARLPEPLRDAFPFVIAGKEGWLTDDLRQTVDDLHHKAELQFLGYVPQDDLPAIYAGARAVVYPSLYEGFGLPVAEAMASGVPVVTSNVSTMPEVAASAALLVPPTDLDAMADALSRVLQDESLRSAKISAGLARASQLTWDACAEKTVAAYRAVLSAA